MDKLLMKVRLSFAPRLINTENGMTNPIAMIRVMIKDFILIDFTGIRCKKLEHTIEKTNDNNIGVRKFLKI